NKNFHQSCTRSERTLRCHQRCAHKAPGPGNDPNATKLILIRVVFASWKQTVKSCRAGDNFFRFRFRRQQFNERHNLEPAHIIDRPVSDQSWLRVTNRNGKIGDYAVAVCLAGIRIETGWKINRKNVGALFCPQLVDSATGGANRLAEWWLCADAKQAIQ